MDGSTSYCPYLVAMDACFKVLTISPVVDGVSGPRPQLEAQRGAQKLDCILIITESHLHSESFDTVDLTLRGTLTTEVDGKGISREVGDTCTSVRFSALTLHRWLHLRRICIGGISIPPIPPRRHFILSNKPILHLVSMRTGKPSANKLFPLCHLVSELSIPATMHFITGAKSKRWPTLTTLSRRFSCAKPPRFTPSEALQPCHTHRIFASQLANRASK